jgi:bacterioferritin
MGTRGIEIVDMNVNELIKILNRAFADEWLAYYQYWLGAKVVKGPMKEAVIAELEEHAADELRHAEMVAERINQLGGTPITNPKDWFKLTNCGYEDPVDPYVRSILLQNIAGEQCAISTYRKIMKMTKDKDPITYNMVLEILKDEVEHEDDLQNDLEDFDTMMACATATAKVKPKAKAKVSRKKK